MIFTGRLLAGTLTLRPRAQGVTVCPRTGVATDTGPKGQFGSAAACSAFPPAPSCLDARYQTTRRSAGCRTLCAFCKGCGFSLGFDLFKAVPLFFGTGWLVPGFGEQSQPAANAAFEQKEELQEEAPRAEEEEQSTETTTDDPTNGPPPPHNGGHNAHPQPTHRELLRYLRYLQRHSHQPQPNLTPGRITRSGHTSRNHPQNQQIFHSRVGGPHFHAINNSSAPRQVRPPCHPTTT